MYRSFYPFAAIFCLIVFSPMVAFGDVALTASAEAALATAIADAQTRRDNAKEDRFAFSTRVETGDEDNPLIEFSFDPQRPADAQYILLHPSEEENPKARRKMLKQRQKDLQKMAKKGEESAPDRDLVIKDPKKLLNNSAHFKREEEQAYVFSFRPAPGSFNFGDDGGEEHEKKGKTKEDDDDFASHLRGEMFISKDKPRLTGVRFFAPESFKPVAVAKIKHFEIMMDIAPAWPDGPLVTTHQTVTVRGKALFKRFEQLTTVTNFGFEKR
ncbi:MAG: hypothetical protein Q9M33_03615 [Robiginitomaculum sp.]|nr:hypothetical protein [Robiginitomaculum sp.]MDQ7077471.1 hypothetical protein [Robiginitomaculum sp.]